MEPFRAYCTGLMLPVPRGEVRSKSVLLAEMDALHYREDDRSRSSEHDVAIGGFDAA